MQNQPEYPQRSTQEYRSSKTIAITFILSCAVVALVCIAAGALVLSTFFANPPW